MEGIEVADANAENDAFVWIMESIAMDKTRRTRRVVDSEVLSSVLITPRHFR